MTGVDGRLLGLTHFNPNPLAHQSSPTTQQVRADLGLVGTLAKGPDGSIMVGSTIAGTSSHAIGMVSFHIDGVNRSADSLMIPPPPPGLPVSMAEELSRLRTQVQEHRAHQETPPVSRSRERCRRRNAAHPTQTADTAKASAFTRIGPLGRLDASGSIHLEPRHQSNSHHDPSGDGQARRTLHPETNATASSARSRSRGEWTQTEVAPRTDDRRNSAGNSHGYPVGSQDHQDDRYTTRSEGQRHEDRAKGVAVQSRQCLPGHSVSRSQQRSPGHSAHNSQRHPPRQSTGPSQAPREDSQGLLPEERCKVRSSGGALTVVNTRTGERTTYRVTQHQMVPPPQERKTRRH